MGPAASGGDARLLGACKGGVFADGGCDIAESKQALSSVLLLALLIGLMLWLRCLQLNHPINNYITGIQVSAARLLWRLVL